MPRDRIVATGGRRIALVLAVAVLLAAGACTLPKRQTTGGSAGAAVNLCDTLAANPRDKAKTAGGVPTDELVPARAIPACRAAVAADPRSPRLMYQLGRALDVAGELQEAANWYRKAAEAGHAVAQTSLGNMYEFGEGVEQSDAEAFKWYTRGAESGDAWAYSSLALFHEEGREVPRDEAEALRLYRLGSAGGDSWADNQIGLFFERRGGRSNPAEAARWYRKAAEAGDATGQYNLGVLYETGRGVDRDEAEAARWYKLAADQSHALAQYRLAMLYRDGRGVAANDTTAVALLKASAAQGQWQAQNALAYYYSERDRDLDEALRLVGLALEQEPDNPDVLDTYGWVLYRLGRTEEATAPLERALEGTPQEPAVVRTHLGDVYAELGRTEEARQQWQQALDLSEDEDSDLAGNLRRKLAKARS